MKTTRRQALGLLAACSLATFGAAAQPRDRVWRLGYLVQQPLTDPPSPERAAFIAGLGALGYAVGGNLVIEYASASGDSEQLPFLADDLVAKKVDAIVVASGEPARAALGATRSIPIIMLGIGDPVAFGLVTSLARPGANITGISWQSFDLIGKRFELLKETLPRATRVACLWNPRTVEGSAASDRVREVARKTRFTIDELRVSGPDDLQRAVEALERRRPDALYVISDPTVASYRQIIADSAMRLKIPSIGGYRGFVEVGGLMSYAASLTEIYRRGATYVDRVFRGAKPGDLPIEQPTKFELVINLKTAKALGLAIPPAVLARADEVVQ